MALALQLLNDVALLRPAAVNMATAIACGAAIGIERQVRRRMAGLRTNALVALGAASFVLFAGLFTDEVSPTRVAAQVVSGIGFLGAGLIYRDGFTVHGLNTAATLWCSAAVGLIAGAGAVPLAVLLTGFVVFVNLGLRPFVRWLKRHTGAGRAMSAQWRIAITCRAPAEAAVRALVLRHLALADLRLAEISVTPSGDDSVALAISVNGGAEGVPLLDQAMAILAAQPDILSLRCEALDDV